MLTVKLDQKPIPENPIDETKTAMDTEPIIYLEAESPVEAEYSLTDDLRLIIERVEALDKTDERIKALGKLKGALELLS